jgi:Rrf2 family transcriptional regulator, iron-sulfur cluster assembly transcription factor
MLLSQTAEYALRAMACLAGLDAGEALRAVEVADRTGIPVPYLSKILRRLVLDGLLVSRKGHGGGFALARAPSAIRFADVISATDAMPSADRCAFGWGSCSDHSPCPLHPAWSVLKARFHDWAEQTTLADVGVCGISPPEGATG